MSQGIGRPEKRERNRETAKGVGQSEQIQYLSIKQVTYGCESWTIKKGECQRIDAFELWFWRRDS